MRRTLLLFLLSAIFLAMSAITGVIALATLAPLHIGQPGYSIQHAAEQSVAALTPLAQGKPEFLLTLLERRAADLERSHGEASRSPLWTTRARR